MILTAPSGTQNHLPYSRLWQTAKPIAVLRLRRRTILPVAKIGSLLFTLTPKQKTDLKRSVFVLAVTNYLDAKTLFAIIFIIISKHFDYSCKYCGTDHKTTKNSSVVA